MGLTMQEKKAITREASKRYQQAGKKEKTGMLDELVKITKYNRKYLTHILANRGKTTTVRLEGKTAGLQSSPRKRKKGGGRKPVYTEECVRVLRNIWIFFWYRCGKILAPFVREQMKFLVPRFHITPGVKKQLMKISPATIDRRLKADKKKLALKGKSGTRPGKLLKKHIPVRTYYADADKKPGFFEIDTVHHCGTTDSGEFCLTLSATDVYSGWVELRPLLNKAHKLVLETLPDIKSSLPFPLRGLDSDNGSEFINSAMLKWCASEHLQFTRSRPYRKNDNCFVEQKNNAAVRNFVGYGRFSSAAERDALAAVYRPLCLLLNYFMPTQKLISKTRVGSKIKKVYDTKIVSPYQRLMISHNVSDDAKAELAARYRLHNPVVLQQEVHDAVDVLMSLKRTQKSEGSEALALAALHAV